MHVFIVILIALFGAYVLFSPVFKKTNEKIRKKRARKEFQRLEDDFDFSDTKEINQYDALFADMVSYNEEIYNNNQKELAGKIPKKGIVFDTSKNPNVKVFALVKIIKKKKKRKRNGDLKIKERVIPFPVYLFSNRPNLKSGFIPMPFTSMPIGGENTMTVLCGYAKDKLFDKKKCIISTGDRIVLQNPFEELPYIVYEVGLIDDNDIDILKIADGETEMALLLFLPHKKQRLAVFAKKKDSSKGASSDENDFEDDDFEDDDFEDDDFEDDDFEDDDFEDDDFEDDDFEDDDFDN